MVTLIGDYSSQARTASVTNIALGIALIVSPWLFDYSGGPAVNSVLVGTLIAVLAASRLASLRTSAGLSAINLILALWIIGSPWVYGYSASVGAGRENVILGVAIAILAIWSGSAIFFGQRNPPGTPAH